MGYSQDEGYVPTNINSIMLSLMSNINDQFGTSYTIETFVGTNFYKYAYAMAQRMQENEVKASEIFLKLQQYFLITNETISRPVLTPNGLLRALNDAGYIASIKPPENADAGKLYVCVDVDDGDEDYAEMKSEIAAIIKDSTAGGIVSQGTEIETLVLTNGQSFDFKFNLPTKVPTLLRLTTVLSANNESVILTPTEVKELLLANIAARYKLGKNFEPQKYFSLTDAPWAGSVLLEYSIDDGENWASVIYETDYDELLTFALEDITIVEA